MGASVFLRKGKNTHRSNYGDNMWGRDLKKGHPETVLPGDSSYKQSPNPDTIVDAKKCLPKRARYGLSLEGPCQSLTDTEADASSQPLD